MEGRRSGNARLDSIGRAERNLCDYLNKISLAIAATLETERMVLSPFAVPINPFQFRRELLLGPHDAVKAHQDLYADGYLHRDVSERNIMLEDTGEARRKGILIDLDYAIPIWPGIEQTSDLVGDRTVSRRPAPSS